MSRVRKLDRESVERFDGVVERLTRVRDIMDGNRGASVYDRLELEPGYSQLQHHVDRALHWAEEMRWIIANDDRVSTPDARAAAL